MNGIFIVPTGLGFEIGGHNGDASPAARLIASVSDKLIVHPNVVNASDLIELTDNMLYVEGSTLDRFMTGNPYLREVNSNKVLVVVNPPVTPETINVVSAARAILGLEAEILELEFPFTMESSVTGDGAGGTYSGMDTLIDEIQSLSDDRDYEFDAVALVTPITVDKDLELNYYRTGGVNPWGGIEAIVSRTVSLKLGIQVAHAPLHNSNFENYNEIVDPRISPEMLSRTYLYCVLKGLHKAPRIDLYKGLHISDINFMVSPVGCWGAPHHACIMNNIPIIMVKENRPIIESALVPRASTPGVVIEVENYLEAAGAISALSAGISLESIRRPLKNTKVIK